MPETTTTNQVCCDCGCDVSEDITRDALNQIWCVSCYYATYTFCDTCGCECNRTSINTLRSGHRSCHDCHINRCVNCDCCGVSTALGDVRITPSGTSYCYSCFTNEVGACCECDVSRWRSEFTESSGELYCRNCNSSSKWEHEGFYDDTPTYDKVRSKRKYGIELETSACDGHADLKGNTVFGCKEEGSVDGMEFVSPVLFGDRGFDEVDHLCGEARSKGWTVNSSCGFHIHCDMSQEPDEVLLKVALAYHYTYDFWMSFVSDSRKRNYYCAINDWDHADVLAHTEFHDFLCNWAHDKYRWFNVSSYRAHRTFEIRFHSATLNATKVKNWVKAHLLFIDGVKGMTLEDISDAFAGSDTGAQFKVVSELWGDTDLTDFYSGRAESFGKALKSPNLVELAS